MLNEERCCTHTHTVILIIIIAHFKRIKKNKSHRLCHHTFISLWSFGEKTLAEKQPCVNLFDCFGSSVDASRLILMRLLFYQWKMLSSNNNFWLLSDLMPFNNFTKCFSMFVNVDGGIFGAMAESVIKISQWNWFKNINDNNYFQNRKLKWIHINWSITKTLVPSEFQVK